MTNVLPSLSNVVTALADGKLQSQKGTRGRGRQGNQGKGKARAGLQARGMGRQRGRGSSLSKVALFILSLSNDII